MLVTLEIDNKTYTQKYFVGIKIKSKSKSKLTTFWNSFMNLAF